MSEEIEDKPKPANNWLIGAGIVGVMLLVVAALRLGADNYLLKLDLEKSECIAAHWKAKAMQRQRPGCSISDAQLSALER